MATWRGRVRLATLNPCQTAVMMPPVPRDEVTLAMFVPIFFYSSRRLTGEFKNAVRYSNDQSKCCVHALLSAQSSGPLLRRI
jgi:hypothetical protein